jgi:cell division protein ZapA (FtsZ GTPase activity inhibitor)
MSTAAETVKVISILGTDYSIKAPADAAQAIVDAAEMLKATLAETKRKYPTLVGDKLLVLAAMNLCSQQLELQKAHAEDLQRYRQQVDATVEVVSKTIGKPL